MTTSTTWSGTRLSPEQAGYLTAGPGRAAEAALARLLDGGLVRVSRQGTVSLVHQNAYGATTPIEAQILRTVYGAGHTIDAVLKSAAYSQEMHALHQHLIDEKLRRPGNGRPHKNRWWWFALAIAMVYASFIGGRVFLIGAAIFLVLFFLNSRKGVLTRRGKTAIAQVSAVDRVHAVALYGFQGTTGGRPVADYFGLSQSVVLMIPMKRRRNKHHRSYSDGGGCGSSSSCSSCGSASSCSSSSGSSCSSGGSSCGGGGCGGGGGGD